MVFVLRKIILRAGANCATALSTTRFYNVLFNLSSRPAAVICMSGWHASTVESRCDLISIIGIQRQRPVKRDGGSDNASMYSYAVLVSGSHACQVARGFHYTWHAPCLNGASHRGCIRCGENMGMCLHGNWDILLSILRSG